jgi:hypothetical protein
MLQIVMSWLDPLCFDDLLSTCLVLLE